MPKVTVNVEPTIKMKKKPVRTPKATPKRVVPKKVVAKTAAPKKAAPKKEATTFVVPMCDEECNLRAKWKVESHDDPDGDYYYVCNQHLGKVCEKIVKTSKVKYDIVFLSTNRLYRV